MEDKEKYILEGVFTTFDTVNRSRRPYTTELFLFHLRSLTRKIKIKNILNDKTGEI